MNAARAGGTSRRKPSANPPAISFSIDKDIDWLTRQGFDCTSPEARYTVERIGMHRLGAYLPVVYDNSRSATFAGGKPVGHGNPELKEVHDLITYDRRVQTVILKYAGVLESQFRARYSRYMSALHGDMALYDPGLFNRRDKYGASMEAVGRELERQRGRNRAIASCMEANGGRVPLGIAVEYIAFGTLSKLYDNTADRDVVNGIARDFNLNSSKTRSWLKTIVNVRNICAHCNPYVVRRQIPTTPLPMEGCEMPNGSPFYIFPMLELMLSSEEAKGFSDRNLDYSARMLEDVSAETAAFAGTYIGTVFALGVPKRFIDPSVGTWEGTAPKRG